MERDSVAGHFSFKAASGLAGARLVLPAWAEAREAAALVEQLAQRGAPGVRVVAAEAALAEGYAAGPLVVVGNLNDNAVMRDLYQRRLAFLDAWFPGEGGYFVRPLYVPSVLPHPLLIIGGSTPAGTRQALAALAATPVGWPPTVSTLLPAPPPPDEIADIVQAAITQKLLLGDGYGPSGSVCEWLFLYHLAGHPQWGALAAAGLRELISVYNQLETFGAYQKGNWEFFYLWYLVTGWRLVEADPLFSDGDRQAVRDLIRTWGALTAESCYLQPGANQPGEVRQNHALCAAVALLDADAYLRLPETSPFWAEGVAQARLVVEGQLASYRPNDDGGNGIYAWNNMAELLHWYLPAGDQRVFELDQVARLADLAILTTDNRRDEVSYGDSMSYTPWERMLHQRRLYMLAPAAWYTRQGAYQWVYQWLDAGKCVADGFAFTTAGERWDVSVGRYASDVVPEYPAGYCGVSVLLLDEGALRTVDRWYADPGRAGQVPFGTEPVLSDSCPLPIDYARWCPQPGRRYLDKLSIRPSFDAADEYLCLKGTGTFCHGHRDANAIASLTWRDRWWLVDLDYIRATPQHHNLVHVVRDGQGAAYPPLAVLERVSEWGGVGLSRTALGDYNGTHWTRTIFWRQGNSFLVIDELQVETAGDYEVTCQWRTLGDKTAAPRRLDVTQAGLTFSILSASDEADAWLTPVRPTRKALFQQYPHAAPEVDVWQQRQSSPRRAGERLRFANLLCVPAEGRVPAAEFTPLGQGLYRLRVEGELAVAGVLAERLVAGAVQIRAEAVYWTADRLCVSGCTQLAVGELALTSPVAFDLCFELATLSGTLATPSADVVFTVIQGLTLSPLASTAISPVKLPVQPYQFVFHGAVRQALAQAFAGLLAGPAPVTGRLPRSAAPVAALSPLWRRRHSAPISASAVTTEQRLVADAAGRLVCLTAAGGEQWTTDLEEPIRAVLAADFEGSGVPQIAVGTNAHRAHLLSAYGTRRWSQPLMDYRAFGDAQRVTCLAALPTAGGYDLVVATEAQHVFVFDAQGTPRWDAWVKYHAITALAAGDLDGDEAAELVVGTEYQTPINVLNPDGTRRWCTWEQVGSEHRSTTVRSGVDVRALALADLNGDGRLEIVYGTGDMLVIALDARDGRHLWKADVGGEVVGLAAVGDQIVVATDNGRVWRLGRQGARLGYRQVERGLTALAVTESGQIAVGGLSGVWLLAPDLTPLGHLATPAPVSHVSAVPTSHNNRFFYTAGPEYGELVGAAGRS